MDLYSATAVPPSETNRSTENDGHENDGPSKLQDMKLQDKKHSLVRIYGTLSWNGTPDTVHRVYLLTPDHNNAENSRKTNGHADIILCVNFLAVVMVTNSSYWTSGTLLD